MKMSMIDSCPFTINSSPTFVKNNLPQPANHVSSNLGMGNISQMEHPYLKKYLKKYQTTPPHPQNSLTPCSKIIKGEINEEMIDPNQGTRQCYYLYGNQGVMSEVCTTPGVDEVLDGRTQELYECKGAQENGINGNADWVRGNQFSVPYSESAINNRTLFSFPSSVNKGVLPKKYISQDPFYPAPDFALSKKCWFKEYPHSKKYTNSGIPFWENPYPIVESFSDCCEKGKVCFWVGIFVVLGSVVFLMKSGK
jgi:hypothetical protein